MPLRSPKPFLWSGRALALASILPSHIFAGVILGWLADHFFHHPFMRAAGAILGTISGFVQLIRELTSDEKRNEPK